MFSKIRDNLFLSGVDDITKEKIAQNNIDIILNVSLDCKTPEIKNVEIIRIGFDDDAKIAEKEAQPAIDFLCEKLKSGNIVLVHCRKGASRSPHIVASVLSIIENKDYDEIYKEIRGLHPRTMAYSIGQEIKELPKNKLDQLFKVFGGKNNV